ncbi:MAG: protein kinase, partial [Deltaproteobacteria bacterium]|nr:protein kinase [Deltaproteobacteria bacterium]
MAGCPPSEQLRGFASGVLSDDVAAAIELHVGSCGHCRSSMASFAKGSGPGPESDHAEHDWANDARLGKRLGRYRIDRVLGMGGMGIVYAAWDPQLDRPVAVKVVHRAAADAAGRARLVREAQSLARLSHPNVCHVYDVGTESSEASPEGDVWVAMELIDGSTLRDWASGKSQDQILTVLLGAGEGIAAAHAAGLIHRDIKPENVLVTRDGRPVVTDFGLARLDLPVDPTGATAAIDPLRTATNAIVGTPAYLAPEQLTGGVLDARVDQFAWAVMAWELLAGVRPFPAMALVRLDAIVTGPKPHPSLTKPLAAALTKAMAAAPRDRYGSLRELMDAVKPAPGSKRGGMLIAAVGGLAVIAVAATVIVWKVMTPAEPSSPPQPVAVPSPPSDALDPQPPRATTPSPSTGELRAAGTPGATLPSPSTTPATGLASTSPAGARPAAIATTKPSDAAARPGTQVATAKPAKPTTL